LDAVRTIVDPGPTRLDELAGRDHRGMANDGDQITLTSGFDAQNAEAVLGVVKRDAVDQPGQDFCLRACPRCCPHHVMMEIKIVGRYRHQAGEEAWCETATAASVLRSFMSV
jgi:hypothetical protein